MATVNEPARLPASLIRKGFMDGAQPNFILETDGESLILRRVPIGGKLYDLRIHRWDANDKLIKVGSDYKILPHVASEIQRTLQVFYESHFRDNPSCNRYFYKGDPEKFVILDKRGNPNDYTDFSGDEDAIHNARDIMAHLYNRFFAESRVSYSPNGVNFVSPKMVAKDLPSKSKESGGNSSTKSRINQYVSPIISSGSNSVGSSTRDERIDDDDSDEELDSEVNGSLANKEAEVPKPPVDTGAMQDESHVGKEIANILPKSMVREIATPQGGRGGPQFAAQTEVLGKIHSGLNSVSLPNTSECDYLKGITYPELSHFAADASPKGIGRNPKKLKLKKALNAFVALVKEPNESSVDCKGMKLWLEALYQRSYKNYSQLRAVYDREDQQTKSSYPTFDKWCKHYAAKAIVGFVRSDKSLGGLVAELEKVPVN